MSGNSVRHCLLVVWGDVEPEVIGPYPSAEARDNAAIILRNLEGDEQGVFCLDYSDTAAPSVCPFGDDELGQFVFMNHYHCERCNLDWQSSWSCACDERCLKCNTAISPHETTDLVEGASSGYRPDGGAA